MSRPELSPEQPANSRLLLAVRREADAVVLVLAGGEDLELAPDAVPKDLPPPGTELPADLLATLRAADARKRAARRIFAILDRRLVSPRRLRRKLADEGHDADAVEAVLERMAGRGLYSDALYAGAWCRDCLLTRQVGRHYLESKLRAQGVDGAVARSAAAAALDPATERELALAAAAVRWRRQAGPADRRAEARVVRFLQGRGFATGLAVEAMKQARPPGGSRAEGGP